MAPRNRTQTIPTAKGRVVTNGNLAAGGNYTVVGAQHYCADHIGPGDCAPFQASHLTIEGGRVNVFNNPNNYWENYRVDYLDNPGFSHLPGPIGEDRSDVDFATQAAARTNPSRPYVDIPVAILELGDVVHLIRNAGRGIIFNAVEQLRTSRGRRHINNAARTNLLYQFGLAPLVGDLVKLSNLQEQVQQRLNQMERLAAPRGYRRTVNVGAWTSQASYSRVMQSNQFFWTDVIEQTTMQLIRVHCRWIPDNGFRNLSLSDRERLAFRSALGLTFDSSTVWEALPWSWLADWASNIGHYVMANRNTIPASLSGVHVMRETRSTFRSQGGINSPIRATLHDKTRRTSFVAPVAHFPFLTAGQMGILGSLAATRR